MLFHLFVVTVQIYCFTSVYDNSYIIGVIDAGSTKSQLQLYMVEFNNFLRIMELPCHDCVSRPGLSGFQNKIREAGPSLEKLILKFSSTLREYKQSNEHSKLIISATGGLRALKDRTLANNILRNVHLYIKSQGILVSKPKIINSTFEGYFALLGLRYAETINNKHLLDGIIELGGASVQIGLVNKTNIGTGTTYIKDKFTQEHVDKITLIKKRIITLKNILIDQGMCAKFTPLKLLDQKNGKNNIMFNVREVFTCGFDGIGAVRIREFIEQESESSDYNPCYPNGAQLDGFKIGKFDKEHCLSLLQKFLNKKIIEFKNNLESIYEIVKLLSMLEKKPLKIYGLSNIKFTAGFFKETKSLRKLYNRALVFCKVDWNVIKNTYRNEKESFLLTYCLNAIYIKELMNQFFKLGDFKEKEIVATNFELNDTIGNMEADWTLGNVIYFIHNKI